MIDGMSVIGEGRRGRGEIIIGREGSSVDFSAPLAPVLAYGAIDTDFGMLSITLREILDDQISIEIVSHRAQEVPQDFEESRRWTYSTWVPGQPCPQCLNLVREVSMHQSADHTMQFVLALCAHDKRLWVYDSTTQINHLIPVTNYYNELMLHKKIRDPKIALDAKRLFTELDSYSDTDLTHAFLTYNALRAKVHIAGIIEPVQKGRQSLRKILRNILKSTS